MRTLYRPVWEGILSSLRDIFGQGWPADKVIQRHLKLNRKWGSHDRKLYAEAVYDMVRWWRKLLFVCDIQWPREDTWTNTDQANFVQVVRAWCLIHDVQLDKSIGGSGPGTNTLRALWADKMLPLTVREALPDWLQRWGQESLGDRWPVVLATLNTIAPVFLRANCLKTSAGALAENLNSQGLSARVIEADCVQLNKRANVFLSKNFTLGHFEVQDLHSQKVAPGLNAEPGTRVVDACAGAGGKSLHLSSLMRNKGKIIAMDVHEKKLEQLRERATRAGATSIEVRAIEGTKTIKRLKDSADQVLLDVPCSGLGVLRRNPDCKWKLNRVEIERLISLQREILQNYSSMCRPGGTLVYATCSILPDENERQIEQFISQNETVWDLESQETLWPQVGGGDGFFIARLKKS